MTTSVRRALPRLSHLWVVIPAYNEAKAIGSALQRALTVATNVVVVDDGSTDSTWEQAASYPVHLARHSINLGQGAALQTGIRYALLQGADVIVTFDADNQMNEREILKVAQPVMEGVADVALGSRFLDSQPAGIPFVRLILLKLAIGFTCLSTGLSVTDTHNGFRAFSRKAADALELRQDRMAHASEILHAIRKRRLSYREVPVTIQYSSYSMSKGQRSIDLLHILWDLAFKSR